jgi:hypothetical protein
MKILDFHVHFFSRPYFEALAAQSPLPGTVAERLARVAERTGIEIPPPDLDRHRERWVAELDRHDVERMACFASAPEETPSVAEACAKSDGRLVPFALVNPKVDGVAERVAKLIDEKGFRGVLLFPALHHYKISDAACEPLLRVLGERKAIAYVHCGLLIVKLRDLLQLPRTIDIQYANPLELIAAANKFPNVQFVIPHFGAGVLPRDALRRGPVPERLRRHVELELVARDAARAARAEGRVRARSRRVRPETHPVRHRLEHVPRGLAPRPLRRAAGRAVRDRRERRDPGRDLRRERAPFARAAVTGNHGPERR